MHSMKQPNGTNLMTLKTKKPQVQIYIYIILRKKEFYETRLQLKSFLIIKDEGKFIKQICKELYISFVFSTSSSHERDKHANSMTTNL